MKNIKDFLQGKKTYIGAAALALIAILGWWFGAVSGTVASGMLAAAFGIAGLGAKGDRLTALTFEALNEAKRVQSLRATGQKIDWTAEGVTLAQIIKSAIQEARTQTLTISPPGAFVPLGNFSATCIFCGQPINFNGGICTDLKNDSAPGTDGQRRHVFMAGTAK
jgi:hypothetical protein